MGIHNMDYMRNVMDKMSKKEIKDEKVGKRKKQLAVPVVAAYNCFMPHPYRRIPNKHERLYTNEDLACLVTMPSLREDWDRIKAGEVPLMPPCQDHGDGGKMENWNLWYGPNREGVGGTGKSGQEAVKGIYGKLSSFQSQPHPGAATHFRPKQYRAALEAHFQNRTRNEAPAIASKMVQDNKGS